MYEYTISRHHFYKQNNNNNNNNNDDASFHQRRRRIEQSFDIYEPKKNTNKTTCQVNKTNEEHRDGDGDDDDGDEKDENTQSNLPTIVLVMGSGWLGHAPWIYRVTNWWNASGAVTIVQSLGVRCISVRHSGGFFQIPTPSTFRLLWMIGLAIGLIGYALNLENYSAETSTMLPITTTTSTLYSLVLLDIVVGILWYGLYWQSKDAAYLPDMVQDVQDALTYIHTELKEEKIILGGYSSGGHVVATWLSSYYTNAEEQQKEQQQQQQQQRGEYKDHFDSGGIPHLIGIFYLSGVLSLDTTLMNIVTWVVFGCPSKEIPSPYTIRPEAKLLPKPKLKPKLKQQLKTQSNENDVDISMKEIQSSLPHLILGCRRETFGIPILDATFCTKAYANYLQSSDPNISPNIATSTTATAATTTTMATTTTTTNGLRTRCVLVDSNHWSILSSSALAVAIQENFPWFLEEEEEKEEEDQKE